MTEIPAKPAGLWHGVPRSEIDWDRKKSVVVLPDQCVVGCQTCANLCPAEAIRFAEEGDTPRAKAQRLVKERKVLPAAKKELNMMQS